MRGDEVFRIAEAPRRDSRHWTQGEITWDELTGWVADPGDRKEAGNYVLGQLQPDTTVVHPGKGEKPCTNLHRRKDFILFRDALTLDIDRPDPGFADMVELTLPWAALLHTTFNSTPELPRYRLIIPVDRPMLPDEYVVACGAVMQQLGREQFDPGSDQAERYMFRPAAQKLEWFEAVVVDGEPATVDDLLEGFEDDLSGKQAPAKAGRNKRDPYELEGVIGAFNRAYTDWDLLITEYELPYEKVDETRYHLVGARSQAGMGPVQDTQGLVFSHHVNDPAYNQTCSAFDLVRLHRYGDLDDVVSPQTPINKRPSNGAMLDLASGDWRVTAELVGADFAEDLEDDEVDVNNWRLGLRLAPRSGKFLDVVHNWDLVTAHDPVFNSLQFNEMSLSVEAAADLPWRKVTTRSATFTDVDRWELTFYIERTFGFRAVRQHIDALVATKAQQRPVNPVRDRFDALVWDGIPRLETCLPGVRPTPFTRLVARKALVAAVARIYEPGIKWDHTLVLYGDEGLGKTWWIEKMAMGYMSNLGRVGDKDTLLTLQRSFIVVSDEGHNLRKGDADALKEFITRTEDVFRMPYERDTMAHPRHCVIWATTNDETFLRRQQGNRRYLGVHCEDKVDFKGISPFYVDQVWAEATHYYNQGELLFLTPEESALANTERERFVEEDALAGVIQEYLDRWVPADWLERSPESRASWLRDRADGYVPDGTTKATIVCSTQIWVEALGRRVGDHRRMDLLEISTTMKRIPGWKPAGVQRVPGYGPQLTFEREDTVMPRSSSVTTDFDDEEDIL